MKNEVTYNDGELELKISLDKDTIWLGANDIANIFDVNRPAIVKHIGNIYKSEELSKDLTCSILEQVAQDGKKRKINYYNLDMILSVGYRVNSKKATKFRQWATSVLRDYISNRYVINSEKITHERFKELENDVSLLKSQVANISKGLENNTIQAKHGIFYDGQIYDAYAFVNDLLKSAKSEVVLIDNYVDETVFTLFSKYPNLKIKIYTHAISKQLNLDFQKYKAQYKNIELVEFKKAHDRFLILDSTEIYHIGASLKDLGKKWFAFSKFEMEALEVLGRLQ
ncbi:MAG: RhuM family protein [Sulfurimonadaceae bacterium]|jgi:prophage antirepressor-like protein